MKYGDMTVVCLFSDFAAEVFKLESWKFLQIVMEPWECKLSHENCIFLYKLVVRPHEKIIFP